jgi:hypothetical protein
VLVDIVQTLPDRTLTVTRENEALRIAVAGVSYTSIRGAGELRADDAALGRMVARLDKRDGTIPNEFLGWSPIEGAETTLTRVMDGVSATWTGSLTLPAADGTTRRLVITEEDHLAVDAQTPGQAGLGGRMVYVDILDA